MTTVTLSLEPRSTAARVSTVAATRAADWRVEPRERARPRHFLARVTASCGVCVCVCKGGGGGWEAGM